MLTFTPECPSPGQTVLIKVTSDTPSTVESITVGGDPVPVTPVSSVFAYGEWKVPDDASGVQQVVVTLGGEAVNDVVMVCDSQLPESEIERIACHLLMSSLCACEKCWSAMGKEKKLFSLGGLIASQLQGKSEPIPFGPDEVEVVVKACCSDGAPYGSYLVKTKGGYAVSSKPKCSNDGQPCGGCGYMKCPDCGGSH